MPCSLLRCCLLVVAVSLLSLAANAAEVTSPNGQVRLRLSVHPTGNAASSPHWEVAYQGHPVLLPSPLSIALADGKTLGNASRIVAARSRPVRSRYEHWPGKRRNIVEDGHEIDVEFEEATAPRRKWRIVARAYNDGVALRFVFPAQEGWERLEIVDESTMFRLPPQTIGWALPLDSFTTSHEQRYQPRRVEAFPDDWLLGLPLLLELPDDGWAAISEANLTDYAGMYLASDTGVGAALVSRLAPLPGAQIAVRAKLPHQSPWRVILLARHAHELINSDLLLYLNAPRAFDDVSWIHPGKTTFPWWNGYHEEGVAFKPGLNTATMKHYIDFCAEAGIPYHSLDGHRNTAWYGGPIVPYEGADLTQAIESIDLPEVLRYARDKGVRLRLWMHWQAAEKHMERAFPIFQEWGIEGVMIDFMDRDDQEMVRFQRRLLELAAQHRLTVTFHGVAPPTGLERTFPNLLTSEGVLNLEYDKWDAQGVLPEHEVTVSFTRMLAGPLDFHQGSFRGVEPIEFRPRNEAPLVIGTPCRTLASYVVWQNHLPMLADYPAAYRGHPLLPALAEVPCTWDDTRSLAGELGQYVVIARRQGDRWWIGALNNSEPRDLRIPLDFLDASDYGATCYQDAPGQPLRFAAVERRVKARDVLDVHVASAGGWVARLTPTGHAAVVLPKAGPKKP